MKDKLKKQLEMLKKSNKIDALLERGEIEEQALLNSSEDLHPADESHTFELLENSNAESIVAVSKKTPSIRPHSTPRKPPNSFARKVKAVKAKPARKPRPKPAKKNAKKKGR